MAKSIVSNLRSLLETLLCQSNVMEHLIAAENKKGAVAARTRLHIPPKASSYVVSYSETEPSHLIVCALALLKIASEMTEVNDEDGRNGKVVKPPKKSSLKEEEDIELENNDQDTEAPCSVVSRAASKSISNMNQLGLDKAIPK
ncbi:hypothetical protein VNO77_18569 [Canavalia gladiata]|uniref:Uncharacterized protein n=1 Tax=Canavalia gladiata TaxID=3824 RepID=A0AAN9LKZ9_CANGL